VGPGRELETTGGRRTRNPRYPGGAARGAIGGPSRRQAPRGTIPSVLRRAAAGRGVGDSAGPGGGAEVEVWDLGGMVGNERRGEGGENETSTNRGSARIRASRVAARGPGACRLKALVQPG
jgi:hypothetical protein